MTRATAAGNATAKPRVYRHRALSRLDSGETTRALEGATEFMVTLSDDGERLTLAVPRLDAQRPRLGLVEPGRITLGSCG
jgi:hypothetical protein